MNENQKILVSTPAWAIFKKVRNIVVRITSLVPPNYPHEDRPGLVQQIRQLGYGALLFHTSYEATGNRTLVS